MAKYYQNKCLDLLEADNIGMLSLRKSFYATQLPWVRFWGPKNSSKLLHISGLLNINVKKRNGKIALTEYWDDPYTPVYVSFLSAIIWFDAVDDSDESNVCMYGIKAGRPCTILSYQSCTEEWFWPNTEDRRSSFMKNFRIPKTEDLHS